MPLDSRRAKTALALTTSALALAAGAATADAAAPKGFDLWTGKAATPGQAHGYGSVTFGAPKKVSVSGKINDICPKDGYGAYVEFRFNFAGGGYARRVISDRRKCGATAKGYSFTTPAFGKRIKSVGVTVAEIDADTGAIGDTAQTLIGR